MIAYGAAIIRPVALPLLAMVIYGVDNPIGLSALSGNHCMQ